MGRVAKGDKSELLIEKLDKVGECLGECSAVQQACKKSLAGQEATIVTMLHESVGLAKLQKSVCVKSCEQKSLPKLDAWKDEDIKGRRRRTQEEDKAEHEPQNSLMDSMKGMMKGMPGM